MRMPPDSTHAPSAGCPPATSIAARIPITATDQPLRSPAKAPPRKAIKAAATRMISGPSRKKLCNELMCEVMDDPVSVFQLSEGGAAGGRMVVGDDTVRDMGGSGHGVAGLQCPHGSVEGGGGAAGGGP